MTIFLPPDVLKKIFLELRKDSLSLHSCALVNSSWCETAISYLWFQPFKLLEKLRRNHQNGHNKRSWNERANCLIQIYVSCIQYQEKINIFSTERQRTTRQQTCNSSKPPTFNYLQYLKRLDIEEFSNAILGMVEVESTQAAKPQRLGYNRFISAAAAAAASSNNTSISSNKARIFNTNILGKILRNQSVGLKSLSI
ncbi:10240_t:CDS:2, partial [Dentiscutata erythropus]